MRRTQALAVGEEETINKAVEARSLYVTPFPYDATLDSAFVLCPCCSGCALTLVVDAELMTFFSGHGTVNSVRLRRHITSLDFNGTAFIEMGSVQQAEALMCKGNVVHEGATLVRARCVIACNSESKLTLFTSALRMAEGLPGQKGC